MKLFVFAVKDRATDAFAAPMFFRAPGEAMRALQDEVNRVDPNNQLNRHPVDFDFYELGVFDTATGEFQVSLPMVFARAQDLIVKE